MGAKNVHTNYLSYKTLKHNRNTGHKHTNNAHRKTPLDETIERNYRRLGTNTQITHTAKRR